jgi:hypothetical protein
MHSRQCSTCTISADEGCTKIHIILAIHVICISGTSTLARSTQHPLDDPEQPPPYSNYHPRCDANGLVWFQAANNDFICSPKMTERGTHPASFMDKAAGTWNWPFTSMGTSGAIPLLRLYVFMTCTKKNFFYPRVRLTIIEETRLCVTSTLRTDKLTPFAKYYTIEVMKFFHEASVIWKKKTGKVRITFRDISVTIVSGKALITECSECVSSTQCACALLSSAALPRSTIFCFHIIS